jgi:hypothetical protein
MSKARGLLPLSWQKSLHPVSGKGVGVMDITDWIIQISIFGVLALAVVGTVQNLADAMKKKN